MTSAITPKPKLEPLIRSAADLQRFWDDLIGWIGSHYLQIGVSLLVAALMVFVGWTIKKIIVRICDADYGTNRWPAVIGGAVDRTSIFFLIAVAAQIVTHYATAPAVIAATISFLFTIASALQAAIWVRELVLGLVEQRVGEDQGSSTLGSAIGIIRILVTVSCFAIALILILDNLGVNVTGLVAGLGVGGIAIGLAAQGIFSDLFAALSIIFDKPFRRGDQVRWDQQLGTVESIGLKTTRIRSVTGEEIVVSNTNLLNKELHNLARLERRRIALTFGLVYQTSPAVCAQIPALIEAIIAATPHTSLVRCGMIGLGASSLDYEMFFDVHSDDYEVIFETRHTICLAILSRFAEAGIAFAYPTQTTFTAAPDGHLVMPYAELRPEGS